MNGLSSELQKAKAATELAEVLLFGEDMPCFGEPGWRVWTTEERNKIMKLARIIQERGDVTVITNIGRA